MNENKKTLIQKAVILPLALGLMITAVYFAALPVIDNFIPFGSEKIVLAVFESDDINHAYTEKNASNEATVKKSEINTLEKNTAFGIIAFGSKQLPIIYDSDRINMVNAVSLLPKGNIIGETGCSYVYGYKAVAADFINMRAGDIFEVNTSYGNYVFSVINNDTVTGENNVFTRNPKTKKGLVIYTNSDSGPGISNTYRVVTAEMQLGPAITE